MRRKSFNVLFYTKKGKVKKNGCVTIMVRITVNREQIQFTSGLEILPDLWDQKRNRVKAGNDFTTYVNQMLNLTKTELYRSYVELSYLDKDITPVKIKNAYLGKSEVITLDGLFQKFLKFCKQRVGTNMKQVSYTKYELTYSRLLEFLDWQYKKSDLLLKNITVAFIEKFHFYLRKNYSCTHNTAMKYVQRLAAVINYGERLGLIKNNPFIDFRIKYDNTDPVFLTQKEVEKIWNKKFFTKRIEEVKDLFIFSCYTGLSYSDIAFFKSSDIQESFDGKSWIKLKRHKTAKLACIPLLDIPRQIIDKYVKPLSKDEILFPVRSNQKTNEYLKEIAGLCGIEKKLTFHCARHTFATLTLNYGVSIESLSKMLGHTNIKTTQVYARITERKIKEEMENMEKKMDGFNPDI